MGWICIVAIFWPGIPIVVFGLSSWARDVPFRFDLSKIHSTIAWSVLAFGYIFFVSVAIFSISQRKDITLSKRGVSSNIFGCFETCVAWDSADNITIRTFRSPSRGVDMSSILIRATSGELIVLSDRISRYPELLARLIKIATEFAIPILRQGPDR